MIEFGVMVANLKTQNHLFFCPFKMSLKNQSTLVKPAEPIIHPEDKCLKNDYCFGDYLGEKKRQNNLE